VRILITGGAGFIGSHLCKKLLYMGNNIVCMDNLSTGNRNNIARFEYTMEKFEFIKKDIRTGIIYNRPIDVVIHLGCPASPEYYFNFPLYTLETGVFGTLNALRFAVSNRAMFIFASTSEIYGDPLMSPQSETYYGNVNTMSPRSVYDESKRLAETLIMTYHRKYSTDTRIMRIFNTYGPNMRKDDGRVVSNFIVQALQNIPLTIYGNGKQTRSFCYIDDLIDGIVRLLTATKTNDIHLPINLGNPQEISIISLAEMIKTLTRSKSDIISVSSNIDDPKRRLPDISRARKLLDWKPIIALDNGLKETINYFRKETQDGE
jgi:nucleoside-diphosphate-sugar epimerase